MVFTISSSAMGRVHSLNERIFMFPPLKKTSPGYFTGMYPAEYSKQKNK